MTLQLTSVFISHGAPDLILHDHPARLFLEQLGHDLPRPDGIVVVSAHWEASPHHLTGAGTLDTIYDFNGFPQQLYEMTYPASATPMLVDKVCQALPGLLIDESRGLDHGAWLPLMLMYPKADIPVVQLSLDVSAGAREHYQTGKQLRNMASDNILIMASGATVHNLSKLGPQGSQPPQWAVAFENWLDKNIAENNLENLFDFLSSAPSAMLAHPTSEHLMPLFVALGAVQIGKPFKRLHHSYDYGSVGMSCFGA